MRETPCEGIVSARLLRFKDLKYLCSPEYQEVLQAFKYIFYHAPNLYKSCCQGSNMQENVSVTIKNKNPWNFCYIFNQYEDNTKFSKRTNVNIKTSLCQHQDFVMSTSRLRYVNALVYINALPRAFPNLPIFRN